MIQKSTIQKDIFQKDLIQASHPASSLNKGRHSRKSSFGTYFLAAIVAMTTQGAFAFSDNTNVYSEEEVILKLPKEAPVVIPNATSSVEDNSLSKPTDAFSPSLTVDGSLIPEINCPLTDNRPMLDLVVAIEALTKKLVQESGACDGAIGNFGPGFSDGLVKAGVEIKKLVADPETFSLNPDRMDEIERNLNVLLKGFDSLSTFFSQKVARAESCKVGENGADQKDAISGKWMTGLSDMVQSLTPYLVAAATANPAFGEAVQFLVGLKGTGNIIQAIGNLNTQKPVSVADVNQRFAILQNICQYYRINKRIESYLGASKSPQDLSAYNQNMSRIGNYRNSVLSSAPAEIKRISEFSSRMGGQFDRLLSQSNANSYRVNNMRLEMSQLGNSQMACIYSRKLAARVSESNSVTSAVLLTFAQVMANQKQKTLSQSTYLEGEQALRLALLDPQKNQMSSVDCAQLGNNYIENLERIVESTQKSARSLKKSVKRYLTQDQKIKNFFDIEKTLKFEEQKEKIVVNAADNSVLDVSELLAQRLVLKKVLFGDRFAEGWWKNKWDRFVTFVANLGVPGFEQKNVSPAWAWLRWTNGERIKQEKSFIKELKNLRTKIYNVAFEKNYAELSPELTYSFFREPEIDWSFLRMKSRQMAKTLEPIDAKLIKAAPIKREFCGYLKNIVSSWNATNKVLESQVFFCQVLSTFVDSEFQDGLQKACFDQYDPYTQRLYVMSGNRSDATKLSKDYLVDMKLVNSKRKELACD